MKKRERMLRAFNFDKPDKIPVFTHHSPAGLHLHGEKLLDLFYNNPADNIVNFTGIPEITDDVKDDKGNYYELKTDSWGTVYECTTYGITGIPKAYPFLDWSEAGNYTFPDYRKDIIHTPQQQNEYIIFSETISLFEKLHALQPFEKVLIDLFLEESKMIVFLDRMMDYWKEAINYYIDLGIDIISFGDDWGTQASMIISIDIFRKVFYPRYKELFNLVHSRGKKVFFHSCGYLGAILDDLIELGIDVIWPQIGLFEKNPEWFKKCEDAQVTFFIHPDRQHLIPNGSPGEISNSISDYAQKYHDLGGGAVFYIEIENDAPFENVQALIESVYTYR